MNQEAQMSAPRSAPRLLVGTFELYGRYPLLFLILAAAVIVPYELIALTATEPGAFSRTDAKESVQLFLILVDWALIVPLVSALHVHAVAEARQGSKPQMSSVARRGLKALPVVAAATIISVLGMGVGFAFLVVPGVILWLRWAVVAQAAAIERKGWLPALSRSGQLARGRYLHIAAFLVMTQVIATVPLIAVGMAFGHHGTSTVAFCASVAVRVVTASFAALAGALLYYDLLARGKPAPKLVSAPRQSSFDPQAYSDMDRPKGWYVDPSSPNRMRHWGGSEQPNWTSSTRTPRRIRGAWRARDTDQAHR